MKRKFLLLSIPMLIGWQACDVTDRVSETNINDLNFWKKVEDLEAYSRNFYTQFPSPAYYDSETDMCVPSTPDKYLHDNVSPADYAENQGWAYSDWENIRGCNYFLTHYQTVVGDARDINHYVGEVRFFRAMLYFNKVKTFGDVPWFDHNLQTNETEELYKPRTPRLTVIDNVIADLEYAADNLKTSGEVPSGRLHKYAAKALLARVCLYEATWQKYRNAPNATWEPLMKKAAATAKDIMDNGGYSISKGSGTSANNNFSSYPLYYKMQFIQEDLTSDPECILPQVYNANRLHNTARGNSVPLSKDFIDQFLDIDGKPIALSTQYLGDDSLEMEIQNRDPRLRNIINNPTMPSYISNGVGVVTFEKISSCRTGYQGLKFRDNNQTNAGTGTTDWYLFRYAETLLIYAEAKAELNECDQNVIDATINKLRERLDDGGTQMGRLTITNLTQDDPMEEYSTGKYRYGYDVDKLLYEIRRERQIELVFEGFRWDDICRWKAGALVENPKTMLGIAINADVITRYADVDRQNEDISVYATASITETFNSVSKTRNLIKGYTGTDETSRKWTDKMYLRPLPKNQITLSKGALTQNCGWPDGPACP